jgi:hypothetical protein
MSCCVLLSQIFGDRASRRNSVSHGVHSRFWRICHGRDAAAPKLAMQRIRKIGDCSAPRRLLPSPFKTTRFPFCAMTQWRRFVGILLVAFVAMLPEASCAERSEGDRDSNDVEIALRYRGHDHHWRIPRNYLSTMLSARDQFKGGLQSFIAVRAQIRWPVPGMQPWPESYEKPNPQEPKNRAAADVGVNINVRTTSENIWRDDFAQRVLPRLADESAPFGDLTNYQFRDGKERRFSEIFMPAEDERNTTIYFECYKSATGMRTGCTGYANLTDEIGFHYSFNSGPLLRWREIDARVRELLNSFLLD